MNWDLGSKGLLYLAAMAVGFGLLAQLLAGRAAPKWLWPLVSAVYFGVGIVVSELWFGWATEEDLQPNIDGLSRDEVLMIGLLSVAAAVVGARRMIRRHARHSADGHDGPPTNGRGQPTPHRL